MSRQKVVIAGSGGIGRALGLLLREIGDLDVDLYLGDALERAANASAEFIGNGSSKTGAIEPFILPRQGETDQLRDILDAADIVLDCLPGSQAPRVAGWALEHGLHYANLTEYVAESDKILAMSKDAKTGFALQCGLAPGYINVLGNHLYGLFCQRHGVTNADRLVMRVGALSKQVESPHFYAFTWSPIGVATEYVKDAIAVRNHEVVTLPALTEVQTLRIDGIAYEEALTSGGAADIPQSLGRKVKSIDYKTLRYPGHWQWVRNSLDQVAADEDAIDFLQSRMLATIPSVQDDLVICYAAIQGKDAHGHLQRTSHSCLIEPVTLGGQTLRAIQSTTAAGIAEVAHYLLTSGHSGPLLQSDIPTDEYLRGQYVGTIYGH